MPEDRTPGSPNTRRYSEQEKEPAVRMVRTLRSELGTGHGTDHGTIQRVARQPGNGSEHTNRYPCGRTRLARSGRITETITAPARLAGELSATRLLVPD